MAVIKVCENCGAEFSVISSRMETAKFCSRNCSNEARKASNNVVCTQCGKPFHIKQSQIERYSRTHGIFCSRKCYSEFKKIAMLGENNHQYGLKGSLNASFKGFEIEHKNHNVVDIYVYKPEHPYANESGRIVKHRLIVEENYLLFDSNYFDNIDGWIVLKKKYQVHHIDGDHNNNDISNLTILTRSEHTSQHNQEKEIIRDLKTGRITGVIKSGELLGTPEVDNQQPSLSSNILEGSTTNNRVQTDNAEDSNIDTSARLNLL